MKALNNGAQHEFQEWGRKALPSSCVIQDLDSWAILVSDRSYEPLALYELKRSWLLPSQWRPFPADRRNYASLQRLAELAGIPFYAVYFKKGHEIGDETLFHVFRFSEVVPEYRGRRSLMTARTFASRFPYPLAQTRGTG